MSEVLCPKCNSEFTYPDQGKMVCTQCSFEWEPVEDTIEDRNTVKILDSNGNELNSGDSVIIAVRLKT